MGLESAVETADRAPDPSVRGNFRYIMDVFD
jgi:hypothetical protein